MIIHNICLWRKKILPFIRNYVILLLFFLSFKTGAIHKMFKMYNFLPYLSRDWINLFGYLVICLKSAGSCQHQILFWGKIRKYCTFGFFLVFIYGKCHKLLNTIVSDKMTYAKCRPRSDCSWRSSLIRVYTVCYSTKYFKKQLHKKHNLGQNSME